MNKYKNLSPIYFKNLVPKVNNVEPLSNMSLQEKWLEKKGIKESLILSFSMHWEWEYEVEIMMRQSVETLLKIHKLIKSIINLSQLVQINNKIEIHLGRYPTYSFHSLFFIFFFLDKNLSTTFNDDIL